MASLTWRRDLHIANSSGFEVDRHRRVARRLSDYKVSTLWPCVSRKGKGVDDLMELLDSQVKFVQYIYPQTLVIDTCSTRIAYAPGLVEKLRICVSFIYLRSDKTDIASSWILSNESRAPEIGFASAVDVDQAGANKLNGPCAATSI